MLAYHLSCVFWLSIEELLDLQENLEEKEKKMKKIYNRKGFKSGVFLLLISFLSTWLLIKRWGEINQIRLVKDLVLMMITYAVGTISLVRSLNPIYNEGDMREEADERQQLIQLKAESKAFRIFFYTCLIIFLLFILLYIETELEMLLVGFITLVLLSASMLLTIIILSVYYEEKFE